MPSLFRRALVITPFLLLFAVTECVLVLKSGLPPARIGHFLLLRETQFEFVFHTGWLALIYIACLLVLIGPSFFPPEKEIDDVFKDGPPPGKPVDVSDQWKERCDKFRERNRRWLLAGIAWLSTAGVLSVLAYLDILSMEVYLLTVVLLIVIYGVFRVAAAMLPTRLDCPNCGCPPLRLSYDQHRWLNEIKECERCRAKLG